MNDLVRTWQVTVKPPDGEPFMQVRRGDWRDAAEVAADTAAWWALSAGERGWDAVAAESDGVMIDGHEVSDLDSFGGCIHCGTDPIPPEELLW